MTIVHARKPTRRAKMTTLPDKPPADPGAGDRAKAWIMEQLENAKEANRWGQEQQRK
jgi:hypothetical protein